MDIQEDVRKISLRNLLFAVARRWKLLLLVACVLAVVAGGAKGGMAWRAATDEKKRAQDEAAYLQEREAYESSKADLQAEVDMLTASVENQQAYLQESELMRMDPYEVYSGTLCLYIATDYQVRPELSLQDPDRTGTVALLYKSAIMDDGVLDTIARDLEMENKYLRQLITVNVDLTGGGVNPILTVQVLGSSQEQVDTILNDLQRALNGISADITEKVTPHTVQTVVQSVYSHADQTILDQQNAAFDRLDKQLTALEEAQAELDGLAEPGAPVYAKRSIAKAAIKYAVVFGLLGLVGGAGILCVRFIAGDRVWSGMEVPYRCPVEVLGSVARKAPRGRLNRWLWRKEGRGLPGDEDVYALAAARTGLCVAQGGSVLIAGQAAPEILEEVAEKIGARLPGMRLITGGSLIRSDVAVKGLGKSDAVILVEQCGTASYSAISRETRLIADAGKTLVGCVAVDN